MKNLFLVDGVSATGKSDLLKWVMGNNADDVSFVVKGTTRAQREYERDDPEILLDLEFLTEEEFQIRNYDYAYTYGGARYGFSRASLTKELLKRDNVFVIVRNNAIINKTTKEYSFINVVPVFVYTDKAELVRRLEAAKIDADVILSRLQRSEIALRDYYAHPEVYREVLINNSSREVFHTTIERLIDKYSNQPSIDPYQIAVMMSFNPSNKKLDDYFDAMEAAVGLVSSKLKCKRVDKVPGSPKIAAEFRNLIANARCVIVDLTENKQNVYYELGFAQAKGKTCLITAEEGTTPFFYPREHRIIFYNSGRDLREKLSEELRGVLRGIPGI
jgi:guanylate kinase